jgi:hypothetical protein
MLRCLYRPALLIPVLGMLAITAGGMLHYNARITGNALTLPYVQDRNEYAIAPLSIWGHLRPEPHYTSDSLRNVYVAEAELYRKSRTDFDIPEVFRKLKNFWIFFLGPLLSVPFVAFWFTLRRTRSVDERRKARFISMISLFMLIAALQIVWFYPHYFAPAFAPFVALLSFGFKALRRWQWRGRQSGIFLSRAIPIGCVLMASIPASAHRLGWRLSFWPPQWALGSPAEIQGPEIKSFLLKQGKKALVFVEYGAHHDPGLEWIYNDPDIDDAVIVWARRVSPESDAALMRKFQGRSVWIVRPDEHPAQLIRVDPLDLKPKQINSRSTW